METEKKIRYTPPTRYDVAPFGTVSHVMQEDGTHKIYIQLSKEEESARWEPIGYLFQTIFHEFILDPIFIETCLDAYNNKNKESFIKISNILRN